MDVRAATGADVGAIAELLEVLGYASSETDVAVELEIVDGADRRGLLVACDQGAVVGFVAYDHWRAFAAHDWVCRLTALAVRPDHRNAGIGQALVAEVEHQAARNGAAAVELSSGRRPEREAAHVFYPALGYADRCSEHAFYIKWLRERDALRP